MHYRKITLMRVTALHAFGWLHTMPVTHTGFHGQCVLLTVNRFYERLWLFQLYLLQRKLPLFLKESTQLFFVQKVHYTVKVHKTVMSPYICNVSTPYGIWEFLIKLLIKYVMKFTAKIRIFGCGGPGFYPLGFDAHFTHVFANSALRYGFAGLLQNLSNFGSTIILLGIIIYFENFLFYGILAFGSD